MANFLVGSDCDGGSHEIDDIKRVAAVLRSCGHEVRESPQCNPSFEGELTSSPDGTIGVMIANGGLAGATYASFIKDMQAMVPNSHIIFLFCYWAHPEYSTLTNESIQNDICVAEHDSGGFYQSWMPEIYDGKTEAQLEQEYGMIHFCGSATSPEEGGQMICNGTCGQGGGGSANTQQSGVSVTKIPDVSFFGVINQICGAVDALFIIANNMAYLLSFSDYYKYRDKYDSNIPKIEASDVIANSLEKDWAVDGFYNAVNVKYKSGELNYQYDALVEKYGENVFYYELPEDDRETAKAKAKALLSAHVRDYSIDLHLQCLYNHKITVGSWVKVRTTLSQVNQNIDVDENSNNIVQTEELSSEKYLTTTEKGYEVFFVQGYNIKWGYEKALIMDLHLKYGPDTPQDPINATYTTGAVQSSGGAGGYGSDCFSGDEICPANNARIMPHYTGSDGTAQCKSLMNSQYLPTQKEYAPRAMQGSSYDQALSGKTPAEAFLYFQNTAQYCYYSDFCKLNGDASTGGDCCNILWDAVLSKQIRGFNCGDSMRMLKVFFDCTGAPACGVHIYDHYFNAVQINGTWEIIDGTRPSGNNTTGFPGGSSYTFAGEHDKSCSPCAF